jgi:hypothetical protein
MAAGRHFEINKKLNKFGTAGPIITKFDTEFHLDIAQTTEVSKMSFFQIQDGRRRKM